MRVAATVLSAVLLVGLAGCGGDAKPSGASSPQRSEGSSSPTVKPEYPTDWMQEATQFWRDRGNNGQPTGFFKVVRNGRVWTGDARQYERVCGATFLLDGDTPPLFSGLHGEAPGTNPRPTYYTWLRSDPKRWSAFNAWLYDPAVVAALGKISSETTRAERIGTTKDCPNADQAGTPAS